MAVRDGAAYVTEAVESVLAQTLADLELVVVDDASRDGTAAVLDRYDDPRVVRLVNEEHRGLARSLNRAVAAARGAFIARHDADDRSLPERLEWQLALLERRPELALCGTWVRYVAPDGRPVELLRFPCEPDEIARLLPRANQFGHGSLLLRRAALAALGGYRDAFRYAQDYDLVLRAGERFPLGNVGEPLYEMRLHPGSLTAANLELQSRYALLARALAAQRLRGGEDALARGRPVDELLAELAPEVPPEAHYGSLAYMRRLIGDRRGERRALVALARRRPLRLRTYARLLRSLGPGPRAGSTRRRRSA